MNVRLTPHAHPARTELYGGIVRVYADGQFLYLESATEGTAVPLRDVALIQLDDDPGELS